MYFPIKKYYFLVSSLFVSALQFKDYLFQCMVSNVYHGDHRLIFRMLHEGEILYLVVYDLGVFQFRLDVLSLEKLKNLLV